MTTVWPSFAGVGVGSGQPGGVACPPDPDAPLLASMPASAGALPAEPPSAPPPAEPAMLLPPAPPGLADGGPPSPLGAFDSPQASDNAEKTLQPAKAAASMPGARRNMRRIILIVQPATPCLECKEISPVTRFERCGGASGATSPAA